MTRETRQKVKAGGGSEVHFRQIGMFSRKIQNAHFHNRDILECEKSAFALKLRVKFSSKIPLSLTVYSHSKSF